MKVPTRDSEVFVVGSGPSLKGFDFTLLSNHTTIVVNKSIFTVPNPDFFISVDYTFLNKIDKSAFRKIPTTKVFVADLGYPFLKQIDGRIVDTRFNLVYRLGDYDVIIKSRKKGGMGLTFHNFCTGKNSGFCALQLAVILGFKKIYLLGMDLCSKTVTHYHGGYGEPKNKFDIKLEEYLTFFRIGVEELKRKTDIEVFSCSTISRLNDLIPFCPVSEVI